MSAHLHLAEVAAEAVRDAVHHFRKPKPAYTDPAAIARWAEWLTPDQWEQRHTRKGTPVRDFTEFTNNAVGIDPADCGCTDCIVGNSVPLDDIGMDELAAQAVRGRPLVNRTSLPLVLDLTNAAIHVVPDDYPDRWAFDRRAVTHVDVWPEVRS